MGLSRSLEVIKSDTDRSGTNNFLFAIHFTPFWDISDFSRKTHLTLPLTVLASEIYNADWVHKTRTTALSESGCAFIWTQNTSAWLTDGRKRYINVARHCANARQKIVQFFCRKLYIYASSLQWFVLETWILFSISTFKYSCLICG